ncbi:MAG: septum formation initiator family protein [Aeromicrobium sp.]
MAARSSRGPGRRPHQRGPSGQRGGRTTTRARTTATARAKVAATAGSAPRLTGRAIVLLGVVLLLITAYTSTLHAWWEQRADIQTTKAQIATTDRQIAELKDQQQRFDDPAYVKQQAKERFGWVLPGEVGYRVIGSDGKVQGGDVPTLDSPATARAPAWYDKLWGSVKESGKEPSSEPTTPPDPDKVLKDQ